MESIEVFAGNISEVGLIQSLLDKDGIQSWLREEVIEKSSQFILLKLILKQGYNEEANNIIYFNILWTNIVQSI